MKGLQDAIGLTIVHPTWSKTKPDDDSDEHHGWTFCEPGTVFKNRNGFGSFAFDDTTMDPHNSERKFIRDFYDKETLKYTVPILYDTKTASIVNNESSEIIQILNSAFNDFAKNPTLDLAPSNLKEAMDAVDPWVYDGINNGVYKCGFAISQEAYDAAIENLSVHMDRLEEHLSKNEFMAGS